MQQLAKAEGFARELMEAGTHTLRGPELGRLVAQLLYWMKSNDGDIAPYGDPDELTQLEWNTIQTRMALAASGTVRRAMNPAEGSDTFEPGELERLRRHIAKNTDQYLADKNDFVEFLLGLCFNSDLDHWALFLPRSLTSIMLSFIPASIRTPIYCPFSPSTALALRLLAAGRAVAFETQHQVLADIVVLAAAIMGIGDRAVVKVGDPVLHPGFLDEDGKPQQFDLALALLPFGVRYSSDVPELRQLYPYKAAFGEVYQLSRLLMHSRHVVAHLAAGFLFRTAGGERSFKEALIRRGAVKTVVAIPGGVLMPHTAINTAILEIDEDAPHQGDVLVASSDRLTFERKLSPSEFPVQSLIETIRERRDGPWSALVTTAELLKNDLNLAPERYVVGKVRKGLMEALERGPTVALEDIAELIRPQAVKSSGAGDEFREISIGDIDELGYVRQPQKKLVVAPQDLGRVKRQLVRGGDILISIKAKIGVVALVEDESGPWLAGQLFVIVRLREYAPIRSPELLARYLRVAGEGLFGGIAHGTTVPLIQMADLKRVLILIPSPAEEAEVRSYFDRMKELRVRLKNLRLEISALNRETWPVAIVEDGSDQSSAIDDLSI